MVSRTHTRILAAAIAVAASALGAVSAAAQATLDPLPLKPSLDGGALSPEPPAGDAAAAEPDTTGVQSIPPTLPALPADGAGDDSLGSSASPTQPAAGSPEAGVEPDPDGERPVLGSERPLDQGPGAAAEGAEGATSREGGAGAQPGSDTPAEAPRPLRFAVIAGRDLRATMSRIEPVAEDLGRILGRSVEMLPMSSYGAMIDAQVQQRIDGGFYSATAFALAQAQCRCLEPIVAPAAYDGTAAFHAIIVAPRDTPLGSAADLEGKIVAAGAADSVGNRRMQIAGLLADGIDPGRFAALRDVASGVDGVRLMLSGGADATFAWSSLAGDQAAGYSRGTLAELVAAGEIEMDEVAIIWRSPAIPHGPVAVLETLPEADKGRIETYLLDLEADHPTAYDALNPYFAGGYVAVEPADYQALDILANEKIDDLDLSASPPGGDSDELVRRDGAGDPVEP